MLISKTWGQLRNKFIVCLKIKLRIHKEHIKFLLELLEQVIFDDSDFHVCWEELVELMIEQESIGTGPKVRQSLKSPFLDNVSSNISIRWQLSSNFHD